MCHVNLEGLKKVLKTASILSYEKTNSPRFDGDRRWDGRNVGAGGWDHGVREPASCARVRATRADIGARGLCVHGLCASGGVRGPGLRPGLPSGPVWSRGVPRRGQIPWWMGARGPGRTFPSRRALTGREATARRAWRHTRRFSFTASFQLPASPPTDEDEA
jgi:hypothetical protein